MEGDGKKREREEDVNSQIDVPGKKQEVDTKSEEIVDLSLVKEVRAEKIAECEDEEKSTPDKDFADPGRDVSDPTPLTDRPVEKEHVSPLVIEVDESVTQDSIWDALDELERTQRDNYFRN